MRNILFILVGLIIITVGSFALWWFFSSGGPTEQGEGSFFQNLFPFGSDGGLDGGEATTGEGGVDGETGGGIAPIVREISRLPVSGFTLGTSTEGAAVFYMERESGHVYEVPLDFVTKKRISNTTFPGVEETVWTSNLGKFFARYAHEDLSSISTYFASTTPGATENSEGGLSGQFFPEGIISLSVGPKNSVFYMIEKGATTEGYVTDFGNSKQTKVFSSPIREWQSSWPAGNSVYLLTKPSAFSSGHLFSLNSTTGALSKIFSYPSGFTALLSHDGSRFIYSGVVEGRFKMGSYIISSKKETEVYPATLSDKCAWDPSRKTRVVCAIPISLPEGVYPDSWYRGEVGFDDEVWLIDTESGNAEILGTPSLFLRKNVDVYRPQIDPSGSFFVFMNKEDLSLVSMRIE